jgi:hypothetical protein
MKFQSWAGFAAVLPLAALTACSGGGTSSDSDAKQNVVLVTQEPPRDIHEADGDHREGAPVR